MKNTRDMVKGQAARIRWVRLLIAFVGLIFLSFALAYILQHMVDRFQFPLYKYAWLAYLVVFLSAMVANLTIMAPVPFAISIMVTASTQWNPILIALAGSLGGTIGELSGYYAGYLGKRIAIPESIVGYSRVEYWIKKYGMWAIAVIAFQPIIPFDLGGIIAGIARMPVPKFLVALWIGKFPKFILLIYAGLGLIHFFPWAS